ncbi:hypothetical protein [Streptomyces sp. NPDC005303]|uniref:hypothetical protein n=1 Tax=Streptomyces sp. NPDC005303 TaxID=3155713 RepID=UPI0033B2C821
MTVTDGKSRQETDRRRSPRRRAFVGVLLIGASVLPALACFLAFTTWLSSDIGRYRDYESARPCLGRTAERAWEDCLRPVVFTVESVKDAGGKGERSATLSGTPFWDGTVRFGDSGPLLSELRPGDRVTGTVWRGQVMALAQGDVRQRTADEPRDEVQMVAALGTLAGLLAVLAFAFGLIRLAWPRGQEFAVWRPYGKRLVVTMVSACFGVGLPVVWLGLPWWTAPVGVVAVVVLVGVLIYRWDRTDGPAAQDPVLSPAPR